MATNPVKRKWTIEEYLAYELETGVKHEFIDGEIYAMAGGSKKHSRIKWNLVKIIGNQLENSSDCEGYDSDTKVKITDLRYVYPDMTVVCGEAVFADKDETMLINPTLVVEVLSPSTEKYDRTTKADYYMSLPSVQAYLLLEQDKAFAQLYTRTEEGWLLRKYTGLQAVIPLDAISCKLSLGETYRDVEFGEES